MLTYDTLSLSRPQNELSSVSFTLIHLRACKIQSSLQLHKLLVESSLSKRFQVNSWNISATQGYRRVCMTICINCYAVVLKSQWGFYIRKFIIFENQICFYSNKSIYTIIKIMYCVSLHPPCCAGPPPQRCVSISWIFSWLPTICQQYVVHCMFYIIQCLSHSVEYSWS